MAVVQRTADTFAGSTVLQQAAVARQSTWFAESSDHVNYVDGRIGQVLETLASLPVRRG